VSSVQSQRPQQQRGDPKSNAAERQPPPQLHLQHHLRGVQLKSAHTWNQHTPEPGQSADNSSRHLLSHLPPCRHFARLHSPNPTKRHSQNSQSSCLVPTARRRSQLQQTAGLRLLQRLRDNKTRQETAQHVPQSLRRLQSLIH